jgi:hypothetical protein
MSTVDTISRAFGDPYLHASKSLGAGDKDTLMKKGIEKKEVNISNDKSTKWK